MANLAVYLKKFREKENLTQGELAERIGVSRQSVIALELGKCIPSVALAIKISQFFGTPVEFIFSPVEEGDSGISQFFAKIENKLQENNKRGGYMARDLMPWSPWKDMMSLREAMDKFFEEPGVPAQKGEGFFYPSVGIRETDKELIVEVDLPGVKEDEVSIEVEDNKLIIKGERKHTNEVKRENYYHLESSYGSFSRVIGLPNYLQDEKADADMKNGILTITIPKKEQKKSKKIQIKAKVQPSSKETKK